MDAIKTIIYKREDSLQYFIDTVNEILGTLKGEIIDLFDGDTVGDKISFKISKNLQDYGLMYDKKSDYGYVVDTLSNTIVFKILFRCDNTAIASSKIELVKMLPIKGIVLNEYTTIGEYITNIRIDQLKADYLKAKEITNSLRENVSMAINIENDLSSKLIDLIGRIEYQNFLNKISTK